MRASSSGSTTAPVGLFGRVQDHAARRPSARRAREPPPSACQPDRDLGRHEERAALRSGAPSPGRKPSRATNSATSSPSSKRAWHTLKTACLAPAVTSTFSRAAAAPCSRRYFWAIASRSAASPADVGVLRAARFDRRDPGPADEVRRREIGLPEVEGPPRPRPRPRGPWPSCAAAVVEDGVSAAIRPDSRRCLHRRPFQDRREARETPRAASCPIATSDRARPRSRPRKPRPSRGARTAPRTGRATARTGPPPRRPRSSSRRGRASPGNACRIVSRISCR